MNKETLQSYNSRLEKNNVSLQDVLDEVNKLQEKEEIILQDKDVTPTKETQTITPDVDFTGLNKVTVNPIPDNYIEPDGSLAITENGEVDVTTFRTARVGVYTPPNLQSTETTPTKETQTLTPEEGYDGFNEVVVKPIPNNYVELVEKNIGQEFYDAYSKIYDQDLYSYNKKYDTDEKTVLYTPDATYKYYVIFNKSSAGFQVMWCLTPFFRQYQTSKLSFYRTLYFGNSSYKFVNSDGVKDNKMTLTQFWIGDLNYGYAYEGPHFDTIEEAINALKDSSTVYKKVSNAYQYPYIKAYGDTQTCVVVTNGVEMGLTGLLNESARQISSNETIEVIPTE